MAEGARERRFEDRVVERLRALPDGAVEASVQRPHRLVASVRPERALEVCRLLKDMGFDHLSCVTCVDYEAELELVYLLWSYTEGCLIELRSRISGEEPRAPSLTPLWPGAEFHEREAYDMFGVRFEGCPNLRRVLLPEEWRVFPLRKSFKIESVHERRKRLVAERARAAGARAEATASAPPPGGSGGGAAQ